MLRPTARWLAFERDDERSRYAEPAAARRRFAALWDYARAVNPGIGDDWEHDLAPDIAVARAVNGLPPR